MGKRIDRFRCTLNNLTSVCLVGWLTGYLLFVPAIYGPPGERASEHPQFGENDYDVCIRG